MEVHDIVGAGNSNAGEQSPFLSLPEELQALILEHVFEINSRQYQRSNITGSGGIDLDEDYHASERLRPLLTCRKMYEDGVYLAYNRTNFVLANAFFEASERLSRLRPEQVSSIRSITVKADLAHLEHIVRWRNHPFDTPILNLDVLTVAVDRPRIPLGYTASFCDMLRGLCGVKRFILVCRQTQERKSLKSWYNLLVGTIMRIDHRERYDVPLPMPEKVWWRWGYDEVGHIICLESQPPKPLMDEESYMQWIKPLMEEFKASVESEA